LEVVNPPSVTGSLFASVVTVPDDSAEVETAAPLMYVRQLVVFVTLSHVHAM
jgi:hypothetical protein